jgi:hypothetical protein
MKVRKFIASATLALILVTAVSGTVSPAILEKASQLLTLVRTQANPIALSDFQRRLPNGGLVNYSLPAGTAFVLTKLSWNFTATDPNLSGDVLFTVGNYYRTRLTLVNGYVGNADGIPLGVPITNMSQAVKVTLFGDAAQTPIAGTLSIRLIGYTAPDI